MGNNSTKNTDTENKDTKNHMYDYLDIKLKKEVDKNVIVNGKYETKKSNDDKLNVFPDTFGLFCQKHGITNHLLIEDLVRKMCIKNTANYRYLALTLDFPFTKDGKVCTYENIDQHDIFIIRLLCNLKHPDIKVLLYTCEKNNLKIINPRNEMHEVARKYIFDVNEAKDNVKITQISPRMLDELSTSTDPDTLASLQLLLILYKTNVVLDRYKSVEPGRKTSAPSAPFADEETSEEGEPGKIVKVEPAEKIAEEIAEEGSV